MQSKQFQQSELTMEVGGWVQVSPIKMCWENRLKIAILIPVPEGSKFVVFW